MCDAAGMEIGNGKTDCSNENFLGSVCSVQCDFKYKLVGSAEKICSNHPVIGADWEMETFEPFCEPICQPLENFPNGEITCSNERELFHQIICIDVYINIF